MTRRLAVLTLVPWLIPVPGLADPSRRWAVPLHEPGLPNLHRVTDQLYRSAQPSPEGMLAADRLGITTVINLRAFHSDEDEIRSTRLRLESIRFKTWHAEQEDVLKFLALVTRPHTGSILVHCQHGADRTGMMVAVYRMVVQGWTRDEAIREMTSGGFGYHPIWTNLIRYLNSVDVTAMREAARRPSPPAPPAKAAGESPPRRHAGRREPALARRIGD